MQELGPVELHVDSQREPLIGSTVLSSQNQRIDNIKKKTIHDVQSTTTGGEFERLPIPLRILTCLFFAVVGLGSFLFGSKKKQEIPATHFKLKTESDRKIAGSLQTLDIARRKSVEVDKKLRAEQSPGILEAGRDPTEMHYTIASNSNEEALFNVLNGIELTPQEKGEIELGLAKIIIQETDKGNYKEAIKSVNSLYKGIAEKRGLGKQFKVELARIRGESFAEKTIVSTFNVGGEEFNEKARAVALDLGESYLNQTPASASGGAERSRSSTSSSRSRVSTTTFRTSALKKEAGFQGVATNLWKHEVLSKEGQVIDTELRSGAFALHNREKHIKAERSKEKSHLKGIVQKAKLEINRLKLQLKTTKDTDTIRAIKSAIKANRQSVEKYEAQIKALGKSCRNGGLHRMQVLRGDIAKAKNKADGALKKARNDLESYEGDPSETALREKRVAECEKRAALIEDQMAQKLGFPTLAAFDTEIAARRDLLIAQALPKIQASVEQMASDPVALANAMRTGSFLHVEDSFLSHLDGSEKCMIEDMRAAMDYLRENMTVEVRSGENPATVTRSVSDIFDLNPKIKLTVHTPTMEEGKPKVFKMKTLFFTQGVNEAQAFGRVFKGRDALQDETNLVALNELLTYADAVLSKPPPLEETNREEIAAALKAVRDHYSSSGEREPADIKGFLLRRKLIKALHAGKGTVCKSGKDRTGGGVSLQLAHAIVDHQNQKGKDPATSAARTEEARIHLLEGVSYDITSINSGQAKAYAFNGLIQRPFLPAEICPPGRLCGHVAS